MRRPTLVVLLALAACGRTEPRDGERTSLEPEPPRMPACGDGILDPGEACDDGNRADTDACRATCARATCGDGVVWAGVEACDDGNASDADACKSNCGPPQCGDAIVQPGEACDDGDRDDGDACLTSCALAFCGDGFVQRGVEACDDGNRLDTDACLSTCVPARCGDGFVQRGVEACDDGNRTDDDGCDNTCKLPVCGDGKRAGAEECDLGAANGDLPAFLISQPSGTRIATDALIRFTPAPAFYDYFSASSHTGLEEVGESRIYLYVDGQTGGLSLILTHGIDLGATGEEQPDSAVDMEVTGLPRGFTVDLTDDRAEEFFSTGPTSARGRWRFDQNSDGGVIGGLPFPGTWVITVTPSFARGITTWGWVKHDETRIPLVMTEPITIQAFDSSARCRMDCTLPRCGDGRLDGGEVCDDGNVSGGDGCAADCRSLR